MISFLKRQKRSVLNADHVRWAYRLFLDREPESQEAIAEFLRGCGTTEQLRNAFTGSHEFQRRNPSLAFDKKTVIYETSHGFRQFLFLGDYAVSGMILSEAYEPHETRFICANCKPGDVALDIGANIGYYSLLMAKIVGPAGFVYAFEPDEGLCSFIRRSVSENRFEERCAIHRCALGDRQGTVQFRVKPKRGQDPSDPQYYSNLHIAEGDSDEDPSAFMQVEMKTLDSILSHDPERRVAFVKIDAEGAEYLVFQGAQQMLQRDRPVILSEIHGPQLGNVSRVKVLEYVKFLEDFDYRCHAIGDDGTATKIDPGQVFNSAQFLKSPVVNVAFKPV
jgi:FkbM family methyltransferase